MIEFMRTTDITLFNLLSFFSTFLFFLCTVFQIKDIQKIPGRISKYIIKSIDSEKSKKKISIILAFFEIIIFVYISSVNAGYYGRWFGKPLNMLGNYFGVITIGPLILALVSFILGFDIVRVYDTIAPSFALCLAFSKFGCFTAGCCYGAEWEHGLYSYAHNAYEFPVQLVESACALLIFIVLLLIRKKAKPGTLFPIYIILYSTTRFFSEFARHEPDVIGRLKVYHLCCIGGVVVGFIILLIALFLGDKISRLFTIEIKIPERLGSEISYNFQKIKTKLTKKDKKQIQHRKKRKKK